MAQSLKIIDKLPIFQQKLIPIMDDATKEGARDTLIKAKTYAPFKKGGLRGNTEIRHPKMLSYEVYFNQEYARFQEAGGDAKRRVRNYTTGGTGKAYLKRAGDEVFKPLEQKYKKHAWRVRV